ncbi:FAD-dependent oxidoreductase [Rhodococcus sp. NPDC058521]|uniref:FAD-dependent oxidoreductase n=1 Tax=Rhodococcus sp. NPDC058521 TaxID=3346536 RepID=UPI003651D108
MSESTSWTIQRHCDVAIVGGSAAGLAAALHLVRQRRSVIVIDSGEPRNAPAAHMHGYLSRDGAPPEELTAAGREEVRSYGGEWLAGRVNRVTRADDDAPFCVELVDGNTVVARRVIAATGMKDVLPDIDGITDQWGRGVIHCPFCHGFEVREQRIVQIVTHPMGLHTAGLFRQLTERLHIVVADGVDVDSSQLDALRASGVDVRSADVTRVVSGGDGQIEAVELASGERLDADAVVVLPRGAARAEPFTALGLHTVTHPTGLGDIVETNGFGETAVQGLFAVGNVTDPSQALLHAAAHGGRVGASVSFDLAHDDIQNAARPSGNEIDWDQRYSGDTMWSGRPNGTLVHEVSGLTPGRALDVGAGEGGDALWLAEHGWRVSANDISQRALDRVDAQARRDGLKVDCLHTDANTVGAFESAAFDLVTAQYASVPRTPDLRGLDNILGAVAPGGTLLVVGHDLEPMREPIDTHNHSRPFDPDAYLRVDDFVAALADSPQWDIETHDKRPRPPGAASAAHHVDDIVLRARRKLR